MTDAAELVLEEVAYDSAAAAELVRELDLDMIARYGGQDATPVEVSQFAPPAGTFVVIPRGSQLLGCAGMRDHGDADAELKRMYVRAAARRLGVATALLSAIEARATACGYRRLILETGTAQPEAMALYEARGYVPIPGFGYYAGAPLSRCYAKSLAADVTPPTAS